MTAESAAQKTPLSKEQVLLNFLPKDAVTDEAVKALLALMEERNFDPHYKIIVQETPGDGMYFISHGEVEVVRRGFKAMGKPEVIAKLGQGDIVGEMALVSGLARNADVISLEEPVSAYFLSKDSWLHIQVFFPGVAGRVQAVALERAENNQLNRT